MWVDVNTQDGLDFTLVVRLEIAAQCISLVVTVLMIV